jgi:hypothetical protein
MARAGFSIRRTESCPALEKREGRMYFRHLACAVVVAAASLTPVGAKPFDDSKYPNLKGEWRRVAVPSGHYPGVQYDPHKPAGPAQQAPLTPEYQAVYQVNLADQELGGQAGDPTFRCLSPGMPRVMGPYGTMEIVVLPEITYILIDHIRDSRRIHTDGRDFPAAMADDPLFTGYSVGRWVDEDGDGRYDALIVETRGLKGPRTFEATGIPLHNDNQTIVRERIYLDKSDPNMLHDEITTIDHALTRPWTVIKDYRRTPTGQPIWWKENVCSENNVHIDIGNEVYFLSGDGLLMPSKKDQQPPDLRYFNRSKN